MMHAMQLRTMWISQPAYRCICMRFYKCSFRITYLYTYAPEPEVVNRRQVQRLPKRLLISPWCYRCGNVVDSPGDIYLRGEELPHGSLHEVRTGCILQCVRQNKA